jgi:hypothetical protein
VGLNILRAEVFTRADNVVLDEFSITDADGQTYLDAAGGAIVVNVGHGRESVARVMAEQAGAVAYAHGSTIDPMSRNYGCWKRWGNDFQNPTNETERANIRREVIQYFLTTPGIGDALWPIYAMAKGMHEVFTASRRGGSYERIDPMDFNHKVQGSLDPNEVARRIQWDGAEHQVTRKVNWLKEWIRGGVNPDGTPMDQATNEELGKLVKYITGNTGLLPGRDITVNVQAGELERRGHRAVRVYKPVPKAHTCFSSIEVSPEPCGSEEYNDRTKQGFIKCLREIACEHTDYGMA